MTDNGLVTNQSRQKHAETVSALIADIKKRGATVFAEIDHAKGAAEVGLPLRPTTVILFGNAKAGTPLMQQIQTIGIDLPLKILIWEDDQGHTQVSYNAPAWIAARHGVTGAVPAAMTAMLESIVAAIR
jgi:uncharacterized protein (DUF302 family)